MNHDIWWHLPHFNNTISFDPVDLHFPNLQQLNLQQLNTIFKRRLMKLLNSYHPDLRSQFFSYLKNSSLPCQNSTWHPDTFSGNWSQATAGSNLSKAKTLQFRGYWKYSSTLLLLLFFQECKLLQQLRLLWREGVLGNSIIYGCYSTLFSSSVPDSFLGRKSYLIWGSPKRLSSVDAKHWKGHFSIKSK